MRSLLYIFIINFILLSCKPSGPESTQLPDPFDTIIGGKQVASFVLKNEKGMEVVITNYGARVVSILVPDRAGKLGDIVLGFEDITGYLQSNEIYYGATIGRYANRIANGNFELEGQEYNLARNNGSNHLHGGPGGFHNVVWDANQVNKKTLVLSYNSPDLEEGYPGNLKVTVRYKLLKRNRLIINYSATTDKKTVINLTHHSFFNLKGEGEGYIGNHHLEINADHYIPVDSSLIPTGELVAVDNTPFDFRTKEKVSIRINEPHPQLILGRGFDHTYVLKKDGETDFSFAAHTTL